MASSIIFATEAGIFFLPACHTETFKRQHVHLYDGRNDDMVNMVNMGSFSPGRLVFPLVLEAFVFPRDGLIL